VKEKPVMDNTKVKFKTPEAAYREGVMVGLEKALDAVSGAGKMGAYRLIDAERHNYAKEAYPHGILQSAN
jgi:hypothetical protein